MIVAILALMIVALVAIMAIMIVAIVAILPILGFPLYENTQGHTSAIKLCYRGLICANGHSVIGAYQTFKTEL